jgi:hypothetical protein
VQLFIKEVTVIVPEMGVVPELVAIKAGTFPFPLAPSPIAVLLFVQENVVPEIDAVNEVAGTDALSQTVKSAGTVNVAVGSTVMVKEEEVPAQPFIEGVTIIVAVIARVSVLVAVKAGILPEPLAPNPIAVLLLVHVKVAPGVELLNAMAVRLAPLQTVVSAGTKTVAIGFTVIV